jgi:hypothetical protein
MIGTSLLLPRYPPAVHRSIAAVGPPMPPRPAPAEWVPCIESSSAPRGASSPLWQRVCPPPPEPVADCPSPAAPPPLPPGWPGGGSGAREGASNALSSSHDDGGRRYTRVGHTCVSRRGHHRHHCAVGHDNPLGLAVASCWTVDQQCRLCVRACSWLDPARRSS